VTLAKKTHAKMVENVSIKVAMLFVNVIKDIPEHTARHE
jgi:hypothetical protein